MTKEIIKNEASILRWAGYKARAEYKNKVIRVKASAAELNKIMGLRTFESQLVSTDE